MASLDHDGITGPRRRHWTTAASLNHDGVTGPPDPTGSTGPSPSLVGRPARVRLAGRCGHVAALRTCSRGRPTRTGWPERSAPASAETLAESPCNAARTRAIVTRSRQHAAKHQTRISNTLSAKRSETSNNWPV